MELTVLYLKFHSSPRINQIIKSFDSLIKKRSSEQTLFKPDSFVGKTFAVRPIDLQKKEIFE